MKATSFPGSFTFFDLKDSGENGYDHFRRCCSNQEGKMPWGRGCDEGLS